MTTESTKCECKIVPMKVHHDSKRIERCDWCLGLEESVAVAEFRVSELQRDIEQLKELNKKRDELWQEMIEQLQFHAGGMEDIEDLLARVKDVANG